MNLILFTSADLDRPLPRHDPRARHLLEVLRRRAGDTFDAGMVNGPRGQGTLRHVAADALELTFAWGETPPPLPPLTLLVGLPRPQTARDVLREAATLGVRRLVFVRTDRGEPAYAQSRLWQSDEWRQRLHEGAAQAFDTRIPELTHHSSTAAGLSSLAGEGCRFALDNYEAGSSLADCPLPEPGPACLAVGSERGWSPAERDALRAAGFGLVHLGRRVLRTETACVAGLTLLKARLGWL